MAYTNSDNYMNFISRGINLLHTRIGGIWRSAKYGYVGHFTWLDPRAYFLSKVVSPILQIVFFSELFSSMTGKPPSYQAIGNAFQVVCLSTVFGIASSIAGERAEGTLINVMVAPYSRLLLLWSKTLFHVADSLVSAVLGILFAIYVFEVDVSQTNFVALTGALLVAAFATSGLGIFVGTTGLYVRDVTVPANIAYWITQIFCGVNFPIETLSGWLQTLPYILPLTGSVIAARKALGGAQLSEIAPLLGHDLLVGIGFLFISAGMFRLSEYLARRGNKHDLF